MSACPFSRIAVCLSTAFLLLIVVPTATSAQDATGHFEVYCDGVGFFLANVDGAPGQRKLLLFLRTDFPGIPYVPREEWKDVYVFRDGCAADEKCEVLTHGNVWLDRELTPDSRRVAGKYEIELNGQHIHGQFATGRRPSKHLTRICE
jgi:hypothetical protein